MKKRLNFKSVLISPAKFSLNLRKILSRITSFTGDAAIYMYHATLISSAFLF
ncbi:hypothetical protein CAMGR0001_1359 [Campylobacter gracilis RM3268]|uniref:Uncharacterized protein n=1 Tax=Campylobacter gracilis RM3268 TaxID=553220 RepID=C8PJG0_9BACT|nr:hypothetical protein CAMGR0001_1359 [Campylobacter gracilis RM3268]